MYFIYWDLSLCCLGIWRRYGFAWCLVLELVGECGVR